jgi:hypothetical protein
MEMIGHDDKTINVNTLGLGEIRKAVNYNVFEPVLCQHVLPF